MNKNLRTMGSMALFILFIAGCAVPVEKKSETPAEPEVQVVDDPSVDQFGGRERHTTVKLKVVTVKNATDFNGAVLKAVELANDREIPAVIIAVGPKIDEERNKALMTTLERVIKRREVQERVIVVAKAAKDADDDTFKSHFPVDLGEGDLSVMAKVSPVEGEPFEVVGLSKVLELLEKGLDAAEESQTVISCHCPTGQGNAASESDEKPKLEDEEESSGDSGEENEEGKDAPGLGQQPKPEEGPNCSDCPK